MADLDAATRQVWRSLGQTHGFLAWDDDAISALAVALRRYELEEIVAVVRWSATELAAGRLSPGWFATTFRGAAFDDRYRRYQASLRRAESDAKPKLEDASRAELDASQLGQMGAAALARLRGESAGAGQLELERMAGWRP